MPVFEVGRTVYSLYNLAAELGLANCVSVGLWCYDVVIRHPYPIQRAVKQTTQTSPLQSLSSISNSPILQKVSMNFIQTLIEAIDIQFRHIYVGFKHERREYSRLDGLWCDTNDRLSKSILLIKQLLSPALTDYYARRIGGMKSIRCEWHGRIWTKSDSIGLWGLCGSFFPAKPGIVNGGKRNKDGMCPATPLNDNILYVIWYGRYGIVLYGRRW